MLNWIVTLALFLTARSLRHPRTLTNASWYGLTPPSISLRSMSALSEAAEGAGRGPNPKNVDSVVEPWRSRIDRSIAKSRKIRGGNYVQCHGG